MGIDFDHVFSYHAPSEEQNKAYEILRTMAKNFAIAIETYVPPGADCSAAIRLLRESLMTANSGIALGGRLSNIEQNI